MVSNLRRLAADHAALHKSGLPPNYLFPPSSSSNPFPDDLTQLTILLTGPHGTPYSQGLWRLHLRLPEDYPQSPPKASFRTRIWHPNVEESTGAVCVDTLKKDWVPSLTLKDVLITISCLLIHPNPDSALNSAAGALLQDDYEAFARQARLMTSIHAPISPELKQAVMEAKRRGEDPGTTVFLEETDDCSIPRSSTASRNVSTTSTVIMKRTPSGITNQGDSPTAVEKLDIRIKPPSFLKTSFNSAYQQQPESDSEEGDDEENEFLASKENNPSLSPSPVIPPPPSPHRHDHSVLGKRPLSVLSVPSEPELVLVDTHDDDDEEYIGQTASERNIASNFLHHRGGQQPYADVALEMGEASSSHHRKSAKLSDSRRSVNTSGRGRTYGDAIFSSTAASKDQCDMNHSLKGKENVLASKMSSADGSYAAALDPRAAPTNINASPGKATSTSRSVSASLGPPASTNASTARKAPSSSLKPKSKPRIGVRRL